MFPPPCSIAGGYADAEFAQGQIFFRVGKHYGAKRRAIQVSRIRKDGGAKLLTQRFLHFRVVISQFARGLVGVKIFRGGKISRRQSQKLVLPVEIPPVTPMTGTVFPTNWDYRKLCSKLCNPLTRTLLDPTRRGQKIFFSPPFPNYLPNLPLPFTSLF